MRRILAITLLLAFGWPLVAPLFAATSDPQASLPACCRLHGAHHCTMTASPGTETGPAFKAPPCPFYPAAISPVRIADASLASSLPPSAEPIHQLAQPPQAPHRARTFSLSAN